VGRNWRGDDTLESLIDVVIVYVKNGLINTSRNNLAKVVRAVVVREPEHHECASRVYSS
jgi:ribosomal protein L14